MVHPMPVESWEHFDLFFGHLWLPGLRLVLMSCSSVVYLMFLCKLYDLSDNSRVPYLYIIKQIQLKRK